jgi:hypothetical protein
MTVGSGDRGTDEERSVRPGREQLPERYISGGGDGGVVCKKQEPVGNAKDRDHLRVEGEVAPGGQRPLDKAFERFGEHQADSPAPTILPAGRSINRESSVNKSSFAARSRANVSRPRART